MLNFYAYPQALIVGLSMGSALCVVVQAVALVYNLNRYQPDRIGPFEDALEAALLQQILLLSLLMAQVQNSIRDDLIIASGYIPVRRTAVIVIALLAGFISLRRRIPWPLLSALAAALTLPLVERLSGSVFPLLYGTSLCFFGLRSIHICILRRRELKSGISELSIKEAIDVLPTGILFCEPDGRILLLNKRMQELMLSLTGTVHKSGAAFFESLAENRSSQGAEEAEFSGHLVYRLADGSVWLFSDTTLRLQGKPYYQITAANVSERWKATATLQEQNIRLGRRSDELKGTIAKLKAIYREEETLRAKSHIHDVLGQRIALLIRTLREEHHRDEALLRSFVQNLPTDLRELTPDVHPQQELSALIEMFAGIGVKVHLQGELPEKRAIAEILMDIITESVTNAVRHGFATEVEMSCAKLRNTWTLTVRNSGLPPSQPIAEGSGITGMRRRLIGLGGTLNIETQPRFVLTATLSEEVEP